MSSAPTPDEIWKDARWLAQAVDPRAGLVRLVEMTPETYRDASFLDDRMFEQPRISHLLPWEEVAGSVPADARRDARWIFHIGHVGSTLVARLLGELDGVLSVREPRALRDLTFFPPDVRGRFVPTLQALFSRTFAPEQASPASRRPASSARSRPSWCRRMAGRCTCTQRRAPTSPASWPARIRGRSWREWLPREPSAWRRAACTCLRRVSEADLAAAAWACEMTALEQAAGKTPCSGWTSTECSATSKALSAS